MSSSVCIIYHRQPYEEFVEEGRTVFREHRSPNGIVPSLKSLFARVEKGEWVAWKQVPGKATAKDLDVTQRLHISDANGDYDVLRLPLTADEVKSFYHVTSKEAFWPILHSFPEHAHFGNVDWDSFVRVNEKFAETACNGADPGAVFWVHDYNLWLVPIFIRKRRPKARIAFFHHTPFPSPDIFNILPWRSEIIDSLLACDLVGFHIPRYARNFADAAASLRGVSIKKKQSTGYLKSPVGLALSDDQSVVELEHRGRRIRIDARPVGTNPKRIQELLNGEKAKVLEKEIQQRLQGQKLIISVSRVDYTKGNHEMLEAYERLLERRPELHGRVKLILTAVSAAQGMSVYASARRQIEHMVGRINGRFAALDWTPIFLFTTVIPFDELLAYYRAADICVTVPLRDGLNLVAKEYVAAKEGQSGALVLSEHAGVAVELPEAVMCNPFYRKSLDDALDAALVMPEEEQRERMARMFATIQTHDIRDWADHYARHFAELGVGVAVGETAERNHSSSPGREKLVHVAPDPQVTTLINTSS